MEERIAFIEAWSRRSRPSIAELAWQFGISEKTAHKWIARFRDGGMPALADRSRRPHASPLAVSVEVRQQLTDFRREHPSWGPKKLIAGLQRRIPSLSLPSRSTVAAILAAEGLSTRRVRRQRLGPKAQPFAQVQRPNDLWCIDHKGEWSVEGRRCYPLTLTDAYSRFLLACHGCPSTGGEYVRPVLDDLFREHGLPLRMRSDNGPPFGARGIGGLSRLSVYLAHLGIHHEFITPGQPQENGIHERMHRTLKHEAILPARSTWAAQQRRFDEFRREYNLERPHEALEMRTPGDVYQTSSRPFPSQLPSLDYPTTFAVRRVRHTGEIKWRGRLIFVSDTLSGEDLGLEQSEQDGWWRVRLGRWDLGLLDAEGHLIRRRRALWMPD